MKNKTEEINKSTLLLMSIVFDAIGYLSFTIPMVGEFTDVVWAPLSAYLMMKMYKGNLGKIGGVISFIEEALPGVDVIPTFTLVWLYKFVLKK